MWLWKYQREEEERLTHKNLQITDSYRLQKLFVNSKNPLTC